MKSILQFIFVLSTIQGLSQTIAVQLDRVLQIGNPREFTAQGGVIRWNGSSFQGTDGVFWYELTSNRFGSVTDVDGNVYLTASIGDQEWMLENLRTTRFKDGTPIQLSSSSQDWGLNISSYCWLNNDPGTDIPYGKIYNGFAATDNHGLCPAGWRMPSYGDWYSLAIELGGQDICGGKLKAMGNTYWLSNNAQATNESGFTALGAGLRSGNGDFANFKLIAYWWASNGAGENVYYSNIYHYNGRMDINLADKLNGLSVRCVR